MARPRRRSGNLPAEATALVGRRNELTEIKRKLGAARLLTLVGPGGVGKTRLAIRAARDLERAFEGGAWLVELDEIRDQALVDHALMGVLGLRDEAAGEPRQAVLSYLRDRRLLLVLDNCEHLLDPVARLVRSILEAAAGVRVLAASREPLSIAGEHVVEVPPLELPPSGAVPLAQLRQNEAVMLFVERAEAASAAFELTAANQAAVVDLCRGLDGLPLALELAAVRTRAFRVEQMVSRLADRFQMLAGGRHAALPRHQALQATIDWSYDLLSTAERRLWSRMSAFAGRFTLEDIEAVCASGDVPEAVAAGLLGGLVDKSLVTRQDVGTITCYRLHETTRAYAALKLRESSEEALVAENCARHYAAMSRLSAAEIGFRRRHWLEWMEVEVDNVRAVLQHCLEKGQIALGTAIAGCLGWYWMTRASTEGARWLDALLARGTAEPEDEARASFIRAYLAVLKGDVATARPTLERSLRFAREADLTTLLCQALAVGSVLENVTGDRASSARVFHQAQELADELDDPEARLAVLQARSFNGLFEGDLDGVRSAASEGVRLSRNAGDPYTLLTWLVNLGSALLLANDLQEPKPVLVEGLQVAQEIDDRMAQSHLIDALACHAASSGQPRLAVRLLGAAEAIKSETGGRTWAFLAGVVEQARQAATTSLGWSESEAEREAGRSMSTESAMRLVLGRPAENEAVAAGRAEQGPLGGREAQVAELVAQGLSNKDIAARLLISPHTVDSHIRSIMNKLGCNSRAQIAAWASSPSQQAPR
ncbi:MAG: LuxR family transcriptional regulator [Candidatus Dormibacteraeota bacterium]|nr:LuxR family transcriptional regulator [Candidatus Dormibacteraeota bacterium]